MSVELEVVTENLAVARAAVAEAAARSGRTEGAVELLAAVKYVEPGDLETLAAAGIRLVGENRVEQLLAKQEVARDLFTWDFIGHLQSRKARDLPGRVRLVHSLSTLSAAERLDRSSNGADRLPRRGQRGRRGVQAGPGAGRARRVSRVGGRAAQRAHRGAHDDAATG